MAASTDEHHSRLISPERLTKGILAIEEELDMNSSPRWRKPFVFCVALLAIMGWAPHLLAQVPSKPVPCSAPEYQQFNFWIGDWDAFDVSVPTKKVAHTLVSRILDGCVLLEKYQGVDGHQGESFSIYDATRKVWHQSWVTNRGELLIIEGTFQGGEMVLTGTDHSLRGQETQVRGTWKAIDGGVRETAVRSTDAGKNWEPWFDLIFRPAEKLK